MSIDNTVTLNGKQYNIKTLITIEGGTPTPPPPPPDNTGYDKFGLKMIYPTKQPNGETWFLDLDKILTNTDKQVIYSSSMKTSQLSKNPDGESFKVTKTADEENRFNITPLSTGYDHSKCVLDWNQLLARGYMQSPNDWRNVEMTAQVRINKVYQQQGHSLVFYARGGHHSKSYPCEGSAYKGNIQYSGDSRFQKESGHPAYSYTDSKNTLLSNGNLMGRWFRYKFCCYDTTKDGNNVMMENWLDLNLDNNWIKIDEKLDVGNWGVDERDGVKFNCGGPKGTKFLWGGPQAVFRFDSTLDIDFSKMSVREIQPPI